MPRLLPHDRLLLAVGALWIAGGACVLAGWEDPYFRPWERLDDGHAFRPSQTVSMEASGDLAFRLKAPAAREPRQVVFSTDAHGFRNPEPTDPRGVVILGDSFVAGAGLSDAETLPRQLAERLGAPVYNYGTSDPRTLAWFALDERFAEGLPAVVVWAPGYRSLAPLAPVQLPGALTPATRRLEKLHGYVEEANGLRRLCARLRRRLTPVRDDDVTTIQVDGAPALALTLAAAGLQDTAQARGLERVVGDLLAFARALEQAGSRFVFAPIPGVGAVYPEAFPPAEQARLTQPGFAAQVLDRVRGRVECVDLLPRFRQERSPYLYWRDDTHWRPRAVALAADELAQALRR
jgi:hypothetical protein